MKKLLFLAGAISLLSACSTMSSNHPDTETTSQITEICLYGNNRGNSYEDFSRFLIKSLESRHIKVKQTDSQHARDAAECRYSLAYNALIKGELLARGSFSIFENTAQNRKRLSSVAYKQRAGEERRTSRANGIQDQSDRLVAELFAK